MSATVRIVDIGLGGALVAADRPFGVGQSFSLQLVLRRESCLVRGKVARVAHQEGALENESWLIGVTFADWDNDSREQLRDYLTRPIP